MKKLFRFKYEPCNGTCYAHQPIFFKEMKKLTLNERTTLVNEIVKAHDNLCDNPNYYFGLDLCQESNVFIGHFVQPDRLDTFSGKTLNECILKMSKHIINTEIPQLEGSCNFGHQGYENLSEQIMQACA